VKTAPRFSLPTIAGLGVLLACLLFVHAPFLAGEQLYHHDSINALTTIGLFYDRLLGGASWLWSSDLNAGHPIWMLIESAAFLDPVAAPVYLVCGILGTNWFVPYQITAVLWLVLFALGGALCARHVTRSPWPGVLMFLLLFGGPLAVMSPGQSWGFLMPFRYFSWLVWAYLRLRSDVSTPKVLALSAILTLSLSGYQSAYPLFAMVFLLIAEMLVNRGDYFRWLARMLRFRYLVWLALPILAALPTLAYLQYSGYLAVVPRVYKPEEVYLFEAAQFFEGLFFSFASLLKDGYTSKVWHGTTYFGLFAPPLIVHGLQRAARRYRAGGGDREEAKVSVPVVAGWLVITAVATCGGLGFSGYLQEHGSFLGVRNFGFLLTGALFLLALLAAQGFSEFLKKGCDLSDVALDTLIFAIISVVYLALVGPAAAPLALLAISVAVFAAATFVLYLLRRASPGPVAFAASVILLMTVETLVMTSNTTLSLNDYVARTRIDRDVDEALKRSPRLAQNREQFRPYRPLDFPVSESWPLILSAPAVNKRPAARLPPTFPPELGVGVVTHFFRLRPYERLLTTQSDSATIAAVLGVTRPILELVPRFAFADDPAGGLALVLAEAAPEAALPGPGGGVEVRVSAFSGDRLTAEVTAPGDAVLVYRDNMAPGWQATADGRPADLLVVDVVNKAVAVPPGRHRVEFVYRPWPYLIAFACRLLAIVAALAVCAGLALGALRSQRAQ